VAFELAKYFETSGLSADAAKWYATAAERFRRADWKTKAQEAAVRLGGEVSAGTVAVNDADSPSQAQDDFMLTPPPIATPEPELPFEQNPVVLESSIAVSSELMGASDQPAGDAASAGERKHRRRGRRGGRNRRKPGSPKDASMAAASPERAATPATPRRGLPPAVFDESPQSHTPAPRTTHTRAMPSLPVEPVVDPGGPSVKGRYGDPGLSSRISLLEMQFRRLMTCSPVQLSDADQAPVGPGVFVLTDSDLTSYYYVEACQTLRIAVGNLLRGGSSRRGADSIKPQLAEHLGIPESRVPKYLADHCVVRWLQLDEGASHFAHFVIAVLRPTLNE